MDSGADFRQIRISCYAIVRSEDDKYNRDVWKLRGQHSPSSLGKCSCLFNHHRQIYSTSEDRAGDLTV
jgi:hypothetical protein